MFAPDVILHAGGSSPLARGTRTNCCRQYCLRRFIPARAGNTSTPSTRPSASPVHPRSRGEHTPSSFARPSCSGSSPLARGTRPVVRQHRLDQRFIPARAGNTRSPNTRASTRPVHPRSRGEHDWCDSDSDIGDGSSPLARGTLDAFGALPLPVRFIPARAGNTASRWCCGTGPAVHPRSRGEHTEGVGTASSGIGSSPLARGTPAHSGAPFTRFRFIPARAGNTPRTYA